MTTTNSPENTPENTPEINYNIPDERGYFPIIGIINNENTSFLEHMISKGADVNIDVGHGWTPLHEAIDIALDGMHQDNKDHLSEETLEIIQILIKHGAELAKRDESGLAPLDLLKLYSNNSVEKFSLSKTVLRPVIPNIDDLALFGE